VNPKHGPRAVGHRLRGKAAGGRSFPATPNRSRRKSSRTSGNESRHRSRRLRLRRPTPKIDALAGAVIESRAEEKSIISLSTSKRTRATITQDAWRTIQLTKRLPDVRFINGDFSHFLHRPGGCRYGDIEAKVGRAMQPIFDPRAVFMHGRRNRKTRSCMQVDIADGMSPVPQAFWHVRLSRALFAKMWTRAMGGFLASAAPGDLSPSSHPEILFTGDLLRAKVHDCRTANLREESDRYAQALV